MNPRVRRGIAVVLFLIAPGSLESSVPLYRNDRGLAFELGVAAQVQYFHLGGEGWSEQDLFFRRLRPVLEVTLSPAWEAEAEADFGKTVEGERLELKDVLVGYRGLESKGFRFTFGNDKAVFSRQLQSSSKSLSLIDRGFVGVDDFGSLDRVLGVRVDGRDSTGHLAMAASVGLASHELDPTQMEFESPLNAKDGSDRGLALSARAEIAPLGEVPYDQGDFGSETLRFALGAAAYRWSNDGSSRSFLDRSRGIELSGALRGRGLSVDAEAQWVRGASVDPTLDLGIYEKGEASLSKLSLQSGYLVVGERLEVTGGYDRLGAATYLSSWKKLTLGANHYWNRQRLKLQINYVLHWSFSGVEGENPRAFLTQFQFVF